MKADLIAGLEYVESVLRNLHNDSETRSLSDEEWASVDEGLRYVEATRAEIARYEELERAAATGAARSGDGARDFQFTRRDDTLDVIEDRTASRSKLADALTRAVEGKVDDDHMAHIRNLARRHAGEREWVRDMVIRASDAYVSGFQKVITGRAFALEPEEIRAMSVGTNADGGFSVPTHLDPTIVLTNDGTQDAIRGISRQVTQVVGNVWNGVTSAGVTASWDAELVEVSDDTPTLARASVPLYAARAFVPASYEAFQDIEGLAGDVLYLLQDARMRLEATAHATGSGSAQPTGVFTAIAAGGNTTVSTTAATIGLVDLHATYLAVGARWRSSSSWLMHPKWATAIRELGTAVSASFSGDLREPLAGRILGRPVVESDDAPTTVTTTVLDQRIVFGDFSNFLIVDKPGSASVEFIPNLFSGTNGRPIAARGWFLFWRTGSDSINDEAFQLLMDKTSA